MFYNFKEKFSLLKNRIISRLGSYIFWIILALILGGLISVFTFQTFIAKPEIGVIKISGSILSQWEADEILKMLNYAKEKKNIKGIVLEIDSPGGEAAVIEDIYFTIIRVREKKPIVASINQKGASGGYFIALASNFIYAKPDSEIGSIGAWTSLPWPETLSEYTLPTGPFKDTGRTRQKAVSQLEMLRQNFLGVVLSHRGEKLKLSADELTKAEVYTGIEGLRYGLIDEIGTGFDVIEKAAEYAGITHYRVVDIQKELTKKELEITGTGVSQTTASQSSPKMGQERGELKKGLLPTFYYLIESQ